MPDRLCRLPRAEALRAGVLRRGLDTVPVPGRAVELAVPMRAIERVPGLELPTCVPGLDPAFCMGGGSEADRGLPSSAANPEAAGHRGEVAGGCSSGWSLFVVSP